MWYVILSYYLFLGWSNSSFLSTKYKWWLSSSKRFISDPMLLKPRCFWVLSRTTYPIYPNIFVICSNTAILFFEQRVVRVRPTVRIFLQGLSARVYCSAHGNKIAYIMVVHWRFCEPRLRPALLAGTNSTVLHTV